MSSHLWPPAGGSAYWADPVANSGSLPASGTTGECRLVLDTEDIYYWNGSAWEQITENLADVQGPASATDDAITRFDGTTGKLIQNSTVTLSDAGVIAGASIDADTNTLTNIENADIKAAAAIALNKLAATTINRALVSDGSGFVSAATTTSTEIGYVNGVTSSIQTQLNNKQPLNDELTTISGLSSTGILCRVNSSTYNIRSIVDAGSNRISVTQGNGAGGNPTLDVSEANLNLDSIGGLLGLTDQVTGVLPVANGGTNSSTALNNNRVMVSSTGAIAEAAAITGNRALASDANGIPVAATTTDTELGYVNGVTSAIQTQFDNIRAIRGNVSISSDVTLTDQRLHLVNTSAARSLALPAAAADLYLVVKDVTGSAQTNNITLTTPGAETIDGGATYVMDANYDSVTVVSDGTNFFLI